MREGIFVFYQYQHFGTSEHFSVEYGKNFSFPTHLHQAFELVTVQKGEMDIIIDGKSYTLHKNEFVLIFPNQTHSLLSTDCKHTLLIFSAELVKAYLSKVSGKIPTDNKFIPHRYIVEQMKGISESSSVYEKKGFLYSLCGEFDKEREYKERIKDEADNLLYKIFEFVELNYGNECTLDTLANETGYNYSYLSRYFKKNVGISFNEYVNRHRINNACYLLSNSNYTILRCAMDSGYTSLRSFNRNFINYMSVSPKKYREDFKKKNIKEN